VYGGEISAGPSLAVDKRVAALVAGAPSR